MCSEHVLIKAMYAAVVVQIVEYSRPKGWLCGYTKNRDVGVIWCCGAENCIVEDLPGYWGFSSGKSRTEIVYGNLWGIAAQ